MVKYREFSFYRINRDEAFIKINTNSTVTTANCLEFTELAEIATYHKCPVLWNRLGELRVLPFWAVFDAWNVLKARQQLKEIGRGEATLPTPIEFNRDQTLSIEQYIKETWDVLDDEADETSGNG